MIRGVFALGMVLAAAVGAAASAYGQSFPNRLMRLTVPFPAGGPMDVMARLVAQKVSANLGQMIIENRPGGGGTVGLRAVSNADADGYTLLFGGQTSFVVTPGLSKSMANDPIKGFTPVALVSSEPFVLVVAKHLPVTTLPELIAYAKANPGKVNFGAPSGATPQFVGELFKTRAGVDIVTIPYKGAANVVTDLLAGQIDLAFEPTSVTITHVNDAKVRPLAVTGKTRSGLLPALPTVMEAGLPDFSATSWTGVAVPVGTPPAVIATLNRAINDALSSDDMRLTFKTLGVDPLGGSPQDFAAFLAEETPKWIGVIKAAGIVVE
jgi:tripartite-type tricarboxylate transporter receptor subunit TctC